MSTLHYDPVEAHDAVYEAINHLHDHWGTPGMGEAVSDLHEAVARADRALVMFERQEAEQGIAFQIRVDGVRNLLQCAHEELQRAERVALRTLGRRLVHEVPPGKALDTVFPAGTIVSCPECGEGVYKVTARVVMQDLVLADGTFLAPLNTRIPARDGWKPLACPLCGGRLLKDGRIHTLQRAWV
jgi:hypothetical protein